MTCSGVKGLIWPGFLAFFAAFLRRVPIGFPLKCDIGLAERIRDDNWIIEISVLFYKYDSRIRYKCDMLSPFCTPRLHHDGPSGMD